MNKNLIVGIVIIVILLLIVLYLLYNNSENGLFGINLKSIFNKNNLNIDIVDDKNQDIDEEIQNKTYKNLKKYKSKKYIPPIEY